jgi:hypothetical protein
MTIQNPSMTRKVKLWYVGGGCKDRWTLLKDLGRHDDCEIRRILPGRSQGCLRCRWYVGGGCRPCWQIVSPKMALLSLDWCASLDYPQKKTPTRVNASLGACSWATLLAVCKVTIMIGEHIKPFPDRRQFTPLEQLNVVNTIHLNELMTFPLFAARLDCTGSPRLASALEIFEHAFQYPGRYHGCLGWQRQAGQAQVCRWRLHTCKPCCCQGMKSLLHYCQRSARPNNRCGLPLSKQ